MLKKIRIDGPGRNSEPARKFLDLIRAVNPFGAVPKDMQSYRRADSRQKMYLSGIAELFFRGGGGCVLYEFSEPRSRISKTPGWKLNAKCLERRKNLVTRACVHAYLVSGPKITCP